MEIIAWCGKQSTCSGQWTSPPIGDSRWTTLAVAEIGWNLRDAILETHLWTSEMVSTQIYQIKDLWSFSYCSQNFYFHDILVGFCYLIFIYLCISGLIFWGFLEFWMPRSFLTRLEMTTELKIELWSLMTKSRKINVQLISDNSGLLWHSYFADIETQAVNKK